MRQARTAQIPKLIVRVRFPSPTPREKAQVRTTVPSLGLVGPGCFRRLCNWVEIVCWGRRADLAVVALVAIGLDVRIDRIRDPLIGACEEDGASGNRPGSAAWQVLMWGCAERTTTGAGDLRKRTGRLQTEDTA
jgi:hypothetical protein